MTGKVWVRFSKKTFFGEITPETSADQPLSRRDAEAKNGLIVRSGEFCLMTSNMCMLHENTRRLKEKNVTVSF
jgi:hypothetical protein